MTRRLDLVKNREEGGVKRAKRRKEVESETENEAGTILGILGPFTEPHFLE